MTFPTPMEAYNSASYHYPLIDVPSWVVIPVAGPPPFNRLAIGRVRVGITEYGVSHIAMERPVRRAYLASLPGIDVTSPMSHSTTGTLRSLHNEGGTVFGDTGYTFQAAYDGLTGTGIENNNWYIDAQVANREGNEKTCFQADLSGFVLFVDTRPWAPNPSSGQDSTAQGLTIEFAPGMSTTIAELPEALAALMAAQTARIDQLIADGQPEQALAVADGTVDSIAQWAAVDAATGSTVLPAVRALVVVAARTARLGDDTASLHANDAIVELLGVWTAPPPDTVEATITNAEAQHNAIVRLISLGRSTEAAARAPGAIAAYRTATTTAGADLPRVARDATELEKQLLPIADAAEALDVADIAVNALTDATSNSGTEPGTAPELLLELAQAHANRVARRIEAGSPSDQVTDDVNAALATYTAYLRSPSPDRARVTADLISMATVLHDADLVDLEQATRALLATIR